MESVRCPQSKCEGSLEYVGTFYKPSLVCDYVAIEKCTSCNREVMYAVVDKDNSTEKQSGQERT